MTPTHLLYEVECSRCGERHEGDVVAVYRWARDHMAYKGHFERELEFHQTVLAWEEPARYSSPDTDTEAAHQPKGGDDL